MLQRLATELNITIIGVSYSGYGYSEGAPDEDQLALDSEAAYSYLRAGTTLLQTKSWFLERASAEPLQPVWQPSTHSLFWLSTARFPQLPM